MSSNFFVAGAAAMTSSKDDWETPQKLFDELNAKYSFTLDPCCTHENKKCEKHFTEEDDGLSQSWAGERVYCNPPYGRGIGKWVEKCYNETHGGGCPLVVALIPARTDTSYFHDWIYKKDGVSVDFLRGRLKFEVGGKPRESAPFPSMVVVFSEEVC